MPITGDMTLSWEGQNGIEKLYAKLDEEDILKLLRMMQAFIEENKSKGTDASKLQKKEQVK